MNDLRGVIRYSTFVLGFAFLAGCGVPGSGTPEAPPNRWADERLWPVLEAQEYRDTDALCTLLKHEASEVRDAAALAFASVQDTLGIPCLLGALNDTSANVRAAAVFALGFVADSLTIERMAELAINERDSAVQRAYLSASFLAMQRNGMLKDPQAIIYFMGSTSGQDHIRGADALRRLPEQQLQPFTAQYFSLIAEEQAAEAKALLIRGLEHIPDVHREAMLLKALEREKSMFIRINAIRIIAVLGKAAMLDTITTLLVDLEPLVRIAALEALEGSLIERSYNPDLVRIANTDKEPILRIGILGLAVRQGVPGAREHLERLARKVRDPHYEAAIIDALSYKLGLEEREIMVELLASSRPVVVRQAALKTLVKEMVSAEVGSDITLAPQWKPIVDVVLRTRDPGLVAALLESMLAMGYDGCSLSDLKELFPTDVTEELRQTMHPLRDFETLLLLDQIAAKRDGLPPPAYQPPPFNHPIDKEKLRAFPQGQRYRITTTKGTIIIATDVNETPGSSLAFDSLVTAGYYNGKAFHRMVPNFVVQGGCPRGDGYGGMPWTLRTEIGHKLFTARSVGLASAGRDTESCQFFITHSATPHLDGRYTRFGEVVEGMDVVWQLQVGDVMEKVERVE